MELSLESSMWLVKNTLDVFENHWVNSKEDSLMYQSMKESLSKLEFKRRLSYKEFLVRELKK